jgi:hypothetical protein
MIFKHIKTKQIQEARVGSPQWEGLNASPSWVLVSESETKEGLLASMPKDTLVDLARQKGATAHHTKDEIVEMLEIKATKLTPYFDDNLVG